MLGADMRRFTILQVSEITLDYTDCDQLSSASSADSLSFVDMPTFSYRLRQSNAQWTKPQWAFFNDSSNSNVSTQATCFLRVDIPEDLPATVLLYYKLTNFYQNHRRYVKSLDTNQLKGTAVSFDTIKNGDCKPLATNGDKVVYPCGLIANSLFNGEHLV